jgi:hypothetical protein
MADAELGLQQALDTMVAERLMQFAPRRTPRAR